ncbi:MAG: RluA family pseudouridine synthase [Planctomycetota bacterium]
MNLDVLFEDNHLLAISKPAGLLVQGDATGDPTLLDLATEYRRKRENKPGNVYLGLVHRLDRPVSGVVLLAKTSKAASRLSAQFRDNQVEKIYWAVIDPPKNANETRGIWKDWLAKDNQTNRVRLMNKTTEIPAGAQEAITEWQVLRQSRRHWLVELSPHTGRSHQLRVHCSAHLAPIHGDRKYGSTHPFGNALALHACLLTIEHPTLRTPISFLAPVPRSWQDFPCDFASEQMSLAVSRPVAPRPVP